MAMKKKARAKAAKSHRRRLGPFDYLIKIVGGRVVIDGENGGNVRARGQPFVKFVRDATTVPRFKITCTEFRYNNESDAEPAWAFSGTAPTGWLTEFRRQLRRPEKGASQLVFKYTIEADVAGSIAADPIIIIDR